MCTTEELNSRVKLSKSLLSYHLGNLTEEGLIEKGPSGGFATWNITEAGSKFLAEVSKRLPRKGLISLENARFRYPILKEPSVEVDWKRVQMKNWSEFITKIGRVSVSKRGSIVAIIVGKTLGTNPWELMFEARDIADEVAIILEARLSGLQLRRPNFMGYGPSKAHFELGGDTVAESIFGFMTVRGAAGSVGDTSAPHREGSVGFFDPRKVDAYMRAITDIPSEIDLTRSEMRGAFSEVQTTLERVEKKMGQGMAQEGPADALRSSHQSFTEPSVFRPSQDRPGFGLMEPFSSIPIPQFGMFQSAGPNPPRIFGLDSVWARPPNLTISFPPLAIDDLRAKGRIFFVK